MLDYTLLDRIYPYIDTFNRSMIKEGTLTLYSNDLILTDYELYCKFNHKGSLTYGKAVQLNSYSINCQFSVNLTLNTEIIDIGIMLNQTSKIIDLNTKNISFVFIKEPISLLNLPKTISKKQYKSNFTLNILDARKNSFVSFTNYSLLATPELHNEMIINCSFSGASPLCIVPDLSFNYVPVKLNLMLNVQSPHFANKVQIQVDPIYHTGKLLLN
jgi:hypothetical protein